MLHIYILSLLCLCCSHLLSSALLSSPLLSSPLLSSPLLSTSTSTYPSYPLCPESPFAALPPASTTSHTVLLSTITHSNQSNCTALKSSVTDIVTEIRTLADRVSRLEIGNQLQAELAKDNRELRLENARLSSLNEASNASKVFSRTTTSLSTFTFQVHPSSMAHVSTKDISISTSSSNNGHVAKPTTYRESVH